MGVHTHAEFVDKISGATIRVSLTDSPSVMISQTELGSNMFIHLSMESACNLRAALNDCIAKMDADVDRYNETKDEEMH